QPGDIVHLSAGWALPPFILSAALAVVLLLALFFWSRERRLGAQRERLRRTFHVGEEIFSASSPEGILNRITEVLPRILGVTGVHLYLHNRASRSLESVTAEGEKPVSISLASAAGGTPAGAVACFHYRTLLVIPDIERSPFPITAGEGQKIPRSL